MAVPGLPPTRHLPAYATGRVHSFSIILNCAAAPMRRVRFRGEGCALPMKLYVEKYLHHLDGMDLSEAEKIEFIRTLWLIAQCFVDDAFSESAESAKPDVSQLKSGFEAANVIDLSAFRQTRAAANDNSVFRAKKEHRVRKKRA